MDAPTSNRKFQLTHSISEEVHLEVDSNESLALLPTDDHHPTPKSSLTKQRLAFTWKISKTILLSLIFLASAIAFVLVPEYEDAQHNPHDHMLAISSQFPTFFPLDMNQPLEIIECIINIDVENQFSEDENPLLLFTLESYSNQTHQWTPLNATQTLYLREWNQELNQTELINIKNRVILFEHVWNQNLFPMDQLQLSISTNRLQPFAMQLSLFQHLPIFNYQILFAAFVLIFVYILLVFELVHRTVVALLGSFVSLAVLSYFHHRPTLEEILLFMDFETIGLLFGMMLMVSLFSETGFFEWCALLAYKLSRGKIWVLVCMLTFATAFLSAFLDNVTTILLIVPVSIRLGKVINISPIPLICMEVIFSNLGGSSSAVGDPPLLLIVSNPDIKKAGIGFVQLALYLAPGVLLMCVPLFLLLRGIYHKDYKRKPILNDEIMKKDKEIEIWRKSVKSLKTEVEEEKTVRQMLLSHIRQLQTESVRLQQEANQNTLHSIDMDHLSNTYKIHNYRLFITCALTLFVVMVCFFLESFIKQYVHMSMAWIALIGAMFMLLASGITNFDELLEKVEWSTLLFFGCLFILMKSLEELGLIEFIGLQTSNLIAIVPSSIRLPFAITCILWISAIVSGFLDNIPFARIMIPIVYQLSQNPTLQLPLKPILFALAYGTCLGGNATLLGASANVVAASLSEANGYPISFLTFFKSGFPSMLLTVSIANLYLLFVHVLCGL